MKQQIQRCLACGHIISKRQISLYTGLVKTLWLVFKWCETKGVHEFQTRDVKHLMGQINYTRFGDWVMFGGLVYKTKKAHYGLNMQRVHDFFKGEYKIPEYVIKDPITGTITQGPDITINEVPKLEKFLNEEKEFMARYITNELPDCPACIDRDYQGAHKGRSKQHPK